MNENTTTQDAATQSQLYNGQEISFEELEQDYKKAQEDAKKSSRFRQITPGKTANLSFTGKIYKRTATGTDDKGMAYVSAKIDFELTELATEGKDAGKNKIFSMGAKNKTVSEMIANLKAGRKTMMVSRTGEGKATKYSITTPE